MSRSVDLFIGIDAPIEELATRLGQLAGVDLCRVTDPADESDAGGRWVLEQGPVRAVLSPHPYVDDGELLLSHYRYALSAQVPASVRLQDAPATALLRRLADRLQHGSGIPVLLVMDLQYRDRSLAARAPGETELDAGESDRNGAYEPGGGQDDPGEIDGAVANGSAGNGARP